MTLSTQEHKVLRALGQGATVSKLTAVHQRIGNVNDVIMRLRRKGWPIETVKGRDINGERFTKYVLPPKLHGVAVHRTKMIVAYRDVA